MSDEPARHDCEYAPDNALFAFTRNIIAGARLARGRQLHPSAFSASHRDALLLLIFCWCTFICVERLLAGPDASFWIWGLMAQATRLHLWLATLAIGVCLCARPAGLAYLIVVQCSAGLPIWLLCRAIEFATYQYGLDIDTPYATVFYGSALLWYCTILWRSLKLLPTIVVWRRLMTVGSYAAMLAAMHQWLPDSPIFYQTQTQEAGVDVETVYYRQQHMLDAAMVELRRETPGQTDLYFVGMAAYAGQDVFMREVLAVRQIVEQQFGLQGRTLTLINNKHTVDDYALANRHNLARVAAGLGHVMDVTDDVAVLFVTSHGYEDASLAVDFENLGLNDIHAQDIRSSFDAAGIRYRVIIISACYSGGFIDALQSPDSIVITASARDRSSFGCGAEEDWTYFGQAYFAQALQHTTNFIAAFEEAAATIKTREARELKPHSQPQIWVGENIARHLRDWQPPAARAQLKESR
jgi:Peptidase C13 family